MPRPSSTAADLIGGIAADDPGRAIIAARMVEIGLPEPALGLVAPAASAGSVGAAAGRGPGRAQPRRRPEAARAALGPVEGAEAATLRARAFALAGAFDQALATLADRGMADAASPTPGRRATGRGRAPPRPTIRRGWRWPAT